MKKYQYEEIVFWLSFIAWMISKNIDLKNIFQDILLINAGFNFLCSVYYAYKSIIDK